MASYNIIAPTLQVPNPFTPMAFLPPDIAFQFTIASYILVGSTAVFTWDVLNSIGEDLNLLLHHRISLPTIAYLVSRGITLAFALVSTIYQTAPTGHCSRFQKVDSALFALSASATSLIFFLRVRAVFLDNKYVVGFFSILWLAVLGTCISVIEGVTGTNLGPTKYCINLAVKAFVSSSVFAPLVNDTLIFFAISYRLMKNTYGDNSLRTSVRIVLFGKYLPALSRTLLQDGQMYYITTVFVNVLTVTMLYVPSVPKVGDVHNQLTSRA